MGWKGEEGWKGEGGWDSLSPIRPLDLQTLDQQSNALPYSYTYLLITYEMSIQLCAGTENLG